MKGDTARKEGRARTSWTAAEKCRVFSVPKGPKSKGALDAGPGGRAT